MSAEPLTLGTAGHIDHGKTALVQALTGVNTDRLAEERERGISIELGYTSLTLPAGRRVSVIDVPGHERFVRTMVAGATGIDLYLMVVAADDGVMPQTREHAAILAALDVRRGVVAVTKCDLADPAEAIGEAAELLPDAEVVPVSVRRGEGLEALLEAIERVATTIESRALSGGSAVLHVDRSFTIRGAGTVVTGTLWSGTLGRGDAVQILPAGLAARVRGVQIHDERVARARAGQRVAVNLVGLRRDEVTRGSVLAAQDAGLTPTYVLDAALDLGPDPPEHGDRVQVHHGTRESPARLAWLGGPFWQLRLEQPLVAARGERLVVRQIAPPDTLGGGVVLDPAARRHGPGREALARLEAMSRGEDPQAGTPGGTRDSQQQVPRVRPPAELSASQLKLERRLKDAGIEPPLDSELDAADLAALREAGRAVRVSRSLHYHPDVLADVERRVIALAMRQGGPITLAEVRDELGSSRKFAQALLEHLDSERVTIRRGEERFVRSRVRRDTP